MGETVAEKTVDTLQKAQTKSMQHAAADTSMFALLCCQLTQELQLFEEIMQSFDEQFLLTFQRIRALDIEPTLMFFGQAIEGNTDLEEDGLPDIVVRSEGMTTVLR